MSSEVKCHLTTRDGWTQTRLMPDPRHERLVIPFRQTFSVGVSLSERPAEPSIESRNFMLVKTAVITDHRRGEQRIEKWFEEY